MEIHTIVIDGGPCAGKTTVMSFLQEKLGEFGYHVIVVPEQATELIMAGLGPDILKDPLFQTVILQRIIEHEDTFKELARYAADHDKMVLLCDRGTMTGQAYTGPAQFESMILGLNHSKVDLRDKRYDAVLFFHSVAVDKPELYTLANNTARKESVEYACALDARTLEAWGGCEHLIIIDNQTDMHGKEVRALQAICRVIGIPQPLEIERKYLVSPSFGLSHVLHYPGAVTVHIEQYYLQTKGPGVERIRARSQAGGVTYYHTIKEFIRPGVNVERQERLSQEEYATLLRRHDPNFDKIEKDRVCFVYQDQYFEFDIFQKPFSLKLLEIELTTETTEVVMPDFLLDYVTDVTDDPKYSNVNIAGKLVIT